MTDAGDRRIGGTRIILDLAQQYGGAETRVLQLLRTLPGTLAVCLAGGGLHTRCREESLPVVTVPHGRADPLLVPALERLLRSHRATVVDAHGVAAQLWGLAAAVIARVPQRIATVHSEYRAEQATTARGLGYETVLRSTRWTATGWIAVSETVRAQVARLGVPGDRITVVRSGVEPGPAPPTTRRRDAARRALGFATHDLVVAVVGRLHEGKGHDLLLEAVARLRPDVPRLRLLIVGDGPERARLVARTAQLGLTGRVTFAGFRGDVGRLLHLADGFCLPSRRTEGLPYAALEAAAAGLPIVAARLGGLPETFDDGTTAVLVPPGDPTALAAALRRLDDPAARAALGRAARDMARRTLSLRAMADATAAAWTGAPPDGGAAPRAVAQRPVHRRARRAARAMATTVGATTTAGHLVALVDRVARRSPDSLAVLMYHRVAPRHGDDGFDPVLLSATPEAFADQVERLAATSHLLTLDEVIDIARGRRRLPPRAVLLTFDDAYAGFRRWAWPVLRGHDAPCVVFAPTAYMGDPDRQFWWEDLYRALQTTTTPTLATPVGRLPLTTTAQRTAACRALSEWIKAASHVTAMRHLDTWLAQLGRPAPVRTTMDWDELRDLVAAGVAVAPHSRTHAMLDRLSPAALADEIHGSIDDLRTHLGRCPPAFCLPAGQRSAEVRRQLEHAGIAVAFSTQHGVNPVGSVDWLDLQRIDVSAAMPTAAVTLALQPWAQPLAARLT